MTEQQPDPDPEHFRDDGAAQEGQDLGRGLTEMAEEDMAAVGVDRARDDEQRADG